MRALTIVAALGLTFIFAGCTPRDSDCDDDTYSATDCDDDYDGGGYKPPKNKGGSNNKGGGGYKGGRR